MNVSASLVVPVKTEEAIVVSVTRRDLCLLRDERCVCEEVIVVSVADRTVPVTVTVCESDSERQDCDCDSYCDSADVHETVRVTAD